MLWVVCIAKGIVPIPNAISSATKKVTQNSAVQKAHPVCRARHILTLLAEGILLLRRQGSHNGIEG